MGADQVADTDRENAERDRLVALVTSGSGAFQSRLDALAALVTRWPRHPATAAATTACIDGDPVWVVRLRALRHVDPARTTADVVRRRAVEDLHQDVRLAALRCLATNWPAEPSTRRFVCDRRLHDRHATVRVGAVRILAEAWRDDPATCAQLQRVAEDDPIPAAREAALAALTELWRDDTGVEEWLHRYVVAGTGGAGTADADRVPHQTAVVRALIRYRRTSPATVPLLRAVACNAHDARLRQCALEGLAHGWPPDDGLRALVEERIRHEPDGAVRTAAVTLLQQIWPQYDDTIDVLSGVLFHDANLSVRRAALSAVVSGWRHHPGVELWLRQCVTADALGLCEDAMDALVTHWRSDPETYPWVCGLAMEHPQPKVRITAIKALAEGWAPLPSTLPLLQGLAVAAETAEVVHAAFRAVVRVWRSDAAARRRWLEEQAMSDERPEHVRAAALSALARLGSTEETYLLLHEIAVTDASAMVRRTALRALKDGWRRDAATTHLLAHSADSDDDLRTQPPRILAPDAGQIGQVAQWVALAVASGVLGNAAYEGAKESLRGHLRRRKAKSVEAPEDTGASATGDASRKHPETALVPITAKEAELLAREAVRSRCRAIAIAVPDMDAVKTSIYQESTGRWMLILRDPAHRRFRVRIPAGRPTVGDVTVEVHLPPS
ncbi:HEAT repeat domain-containing protein [Couchioplanes azureus]|uniref:HEAT repeat domain-containing protein n=1 Tax=Couchioplanes caeruleus TaxID=56438 RepID=UPI00167163D9|nr:HEAT repeat domain-containing protein [Couchioplanes caeruleus]